MNREWQLVTQQALGVCRRQRAQLSLSSTPLESLGATANRALAAGVIVAREIIHASSLQKTPGNRLCRWPVVTDERSLIHLDACAGITPILHEVIVRWNVPIALGMGDHGNPAISRNLANREGAVWRYRHKGKLEKHERCAGKAQAGVGKVWFRNVEHDLRAALQSHLGKLRRRQRFQRVPRVIENIEVRLEVSRPINKRRAQMRRCNDGVDSVREQHRQPRSRFIDIGGAIIDCRHQMVMEIQHVAQFSVGVELPRMTVVENSDRSQDSIPRVPLSVAGESVARNRLFLIALFGLSALYLLQTVSPLRLDSDAVDYLSTGAAIADGRALPKVLFPPGFPAIISLLDRAGLGSSFFFILLNCVCLGLGLWATWRILADYSLRLRMWTVVATLLVISVVKSVASPLPEAAFFGTSLLSLAAASAALSARGRKRLLLFAASFAVAGFAISIRLVGVALIPALLWACLSAVHGARSARSSRRWPTTATTLLVLALVAVVLILSRTSTFNYYLMHPRYWYLMGGLSSPVGGRIYGMLTGLGELIINLPLSRFHSLRPVFAGAGLLAFITLVLARTRPAHLNLAAVYLLFYLAILAVWPYDSPRLWMPIVPLIAAQVVSTLDRLRTIRHVRLFVAMYAGWFALTGLLALAYTSRISLSGDDFPRLYGRSGGMATAAVQTLSPEAKQKYNARADTILNRYGGGRARPFKPSLPRP